MLNNELEASLKRGFGAAKHRRHEFMTVEHLLRSLIDNDTANKVLRETGANIDLLSSDIEGYLQDTSPRVQGKEEYKVQPTIGFQRVLQRAVFQAQTTGLTIIHGGQLLVAVFSEKDSKAVEFLKKYDVTRESVSLYITRAMQPAELDNANDLGSPPMQHDEAGQKPEKTPLEKYATNLNERAKQGKIDPLIGRTDEVERTLQVICRRRKNNPLLVGEPGVGKTALAEGLAKRIVEDDVPERIKNHTIFSLSLGALVAGTKFRGEFEQRLKDLLDELETMDKAILFIDEIHIIIGAGAASGGAMDAANLIKPSLANGSLKCIGATTYQEYRGIFEKDKALARRFQKIDLPEPSVEETVLILNGLKTRFEKHHDVKFTAEALQSAAVLSARYINERFLPDKAIDVIDEAGAKEQLKPENKRKKTIGVKDIEIIISKLARIPAKQVSESDTKHLKKLDRDLKLVVYGQDDAVDALATAIKMSRAGLGTEDKPVGSFLFAGPTGVGKTEIAKQLAKNLGVDLLRFDMSEYMESHTVSRLIGAPPGYVGFEKGGLLTEEINKHPHSVVLMDEIEKAHPDVFKLLLQVMDHGTLTDANGRVADFRNVILIMTTNAGAQVVARSSIGFSKQDNSVDGIQVINQMFPPEFRNRLDAVIPFQSLDTVTISHVVDKFLFELETQLQEKKVEITIDGKAREWLAERGYDVTMGARPMARTIKEYIKKPLTEELLFGKLVTGGSVFVSTDDDGLTFEFNEEVCPVEPVV